MSPKIDWDDEMEAAADAAWAPEIDDTSDSPEAPATPPTNERTTMADLRVRLNAIHGVQHPIP